MKGYCGCQVEALAEGVLEGIVSLRGENLIWAVSFTRLSDVTNSD